MVNQIQVDGIPFSGNYTCYNFSLCLMEQDCVIYVRKQGDTMNVGFIGAGKVGFTLGKFFTQGGIPVTGYYSRHGESAKEAALFTGTKQYDKIEKLVYESDAIFLTVPDVGISSMFEEIKELEIAGKQICHCSGAMTAQEAFPDIDKTGVYGYSIHPLFPISSKFDAYRELPGAFFCLEGIGPHLNDWAQRFNTLGCPVRMIAAESKVKYHAACAISSNLICALVEESLELLADCGFSPAEALSALTPLLRSNLKHMLAEGPVSSLTGPIERNDVATVKKHLSCLQSPDDQALYRAVSKKLVQVAELKNPERSYKELKKLL